MAVQRVENCRNCNSGLSDGLKSATIGGLIGYVSKYALPLTDQEMDTDYKKIIDNIKSQAEKAENEFLASIKANPQRTLAQDAYIKTSEHFVKNNIRAYDLAVKKIRPTAPFVVAGATAGLLYSFVKSIFTV